MQKVNKKEKEQEQELRLSGGSKKDLLVIENLLRKAYSPSIPMGIARIARFVGAFDYNIHSFELHVSPPNTNCVLVQELVRQFTNTVPKACKNDDESQNCPSDSSPVDDGLDSKQKKFLTLLAFFVYSPDKTLKLTEYNDADKTEISYHTVEAQGLIEPSKISYFLQDSRIEVRLSTWHINSLLLYLFTHSEFEFIRSLAVAMKDSGSAVWQDMKSSLSIQSGLDLYSQVETLRKNKPDYLSNMLKTGSFDWEEVLKEDPVLIGQAITLPQRLNQFISLATALYMNGLIQCQEQRKEIMDCFLFKLYGSTLKYCYEKNSKGSGETLKGMADVIEVRSKELNKKSNDEQLATLTVLAVFTVAINPKVEDKEESQVKEEVSSEENSSLLSKKSLISSITGNLLSQGGLPVPSSLIENKVDKLFAKYSSSLQKNKKKAQESGGNAGLYEKRRKEVQQKKQQKEELVRREKRAAKKQRQESYDRAKQQRRQNNEVLSSGKKEEVVCEINQEITKKKLSGTDKNKIIFILKEAQRLFSVRYHACVNQITNQRLVSGKKGFPYSTVSSPDSFTRDIHGCIKTLREADREVPFEYIETVKEMLQTFKSNSDTKVSNLPKVGGLSEQFRQILKKELAGLIKNVDTIGLAQNSEKSSVSSIENVVA